MNAGDHGRLRELAGRYYSEKFAEHGATPAGVDWNGASSQEIRFRELLRVVGSDEPFSILDYGCGYGALASYLARDGRPFRYVGYDVSRSMIAHAREAFAGRDDIVFGDDESTLEPVDFAVASGIFNVKLDTDDEAWAEYVTATIAQLAALGRRGFAYNMLTSYSDPDKMRPDLYYADPAHFFELCKRKHARWVSLFHDYGLWEFTIVARQEPSP